MNPSLARLWCRWFGHRWIPYWVKSISYNGTLINDQPQLYLLDCPRCGAQQRITVQP